MRPFLLLLLSYSLYACNSTASDHKEGSKALTAAKVTNSSYNLSAPERKWELPKELKEISGNAWVDKDHLLVIEDLHPILYLIRLDKSAVIEKTIPFQEASDKKFDIEDVTIANNTVYALWSHGVIYKIANWQNKPQVNQYPTFLTKENNTEGICYDPVSGNLLVACKNESDISDEKKSTRAIYSFDLNKDSLNPEPFMLIHKKDFKKMEGDKLEFYPSGVAVHPITHDIYILSTKGTKCLAQYSHDGQLKNFQFISDEEMPQPEGICFSPDGTLYISSEGKHGTPPQIYQFNYAK